MDKHDFKNNTRDITGFPELAKGNSFFVSSPCKQIPVSKVNSNLNSYFIEFNKKT